MNTNPLASPWTPVDVALPPQFVPYLVTLSTGPVGIAMRIARYWTSQCGQPVVVTAWMSAPAPYVAPSATPAGSEGGVACP